MKVVALFFCLLTLASGASAGWSHRDPARPFNLRMAQLPKTDADLDRAIHRASRPRNFVDDFADEMNIRDGKADLFDTRQIDSAGDAELSGSLDAHGATLRLRW